MGGDGSGRFRRRLKLAGSATRIDAKELARDGALQAGKRGILEWVRQGEAEGERSSVEIETHEDRIVLRWQYQDFLGQKHSVVLPIWWTWSECHLGGRRPWFICPECQKRARILYLSGGSIFACRKCAGITYATRRGGKLENAERKLDHIQAKLSDKGMKRGRYRKTRERIQGQLEAAEARAEKLRSRELAKLAIKAEALRGRIEEAERRLKIAKKG